jgi:hypothetical protein
MVSRLLCAVIVSPLFGGAAMASACSDRISALEARIDEAAETTASVSSGGQGVAAARESQALQARNESAPIAPATVPPFQSQAREAQATREAAETGGGDRVMQARATLNAARTLHEQGQGEACLERVSEAERQLGGP